MGTVESFTPGNNFGWPNSCVQCGRSLIGQRFVEICSQCVQINKEEKLNWKLDEIHDKYSLEQRIRAIERYISQTGGTLKYE